MKRFLVTGGAGFIGSNFIRHLLEKHNDIEVVNLDKLTYAGNPDNLKDIADSPRYKFLHGDICNEQLVNDLMGAVDERGRAAFLLCPSREPNGRRTLDPHSQR